MNTNFRSILSTSTALGLISFVVVSAFVLGAAASATLIGFGLLAVYGMLEIAIVSYESPRLFASPRAERSSERQNARIATVIRYPVVKRQEVARAA